MDKSSVPPQPYNPKKKGRFVNLAGKTFGRLTVLECVGEGNDRRLMWRCRCACGKEIIRSGKQLKRSATPSCNCAKGQHRKLFGAEACREIRRRHEAGESLELLSVAYGCDRTTLSKAVRKAGGVPRSPRYKLSNEEKSQAVADYESGMSVSEVSRKYGVRCASMSKMLKYRDVGIDSSRGQVSTLTPEVQKAICDAIREGECFDAASVLAGIDPELTHLWVQKGKRKSSGMYHDFAVAYELACEQADFKLKSFTGKDGQVRVYRRNRLVRQYSLNENFFEAIDTPGKAWLLGFISGDGNVSQRVLRISVAIKDQEILEVAKKLLGSDAVIKNIWRRSVHVKGCRKPMKAGWVSLVYFHSPKLVADLLALGVMPDKTWKIRPWAGPPELLRHYYRGLVDADGWLCHPTETSKHNSFAVGLCGNRHIVSGFHAFIKHHIPRTRVCVREVIREASTRPHYSVAYGGRLVAAEVARLLYEGASVALRRKRLRAEFLISQLTDNQ